MAWPTGYFKIALARLRERLLEILRSFDPNGAPCDWDKIFWVHCESIGTAAMLATVTGDEKYWADYDREQRHSEIIRPARI